MPRASNGGQQCKVCSDPEADEINTEIAQGYSLYAIAASYCIPYQSVVRHRKEHLLVAEGSTGPVVLTIQDVLDIPLQMRERGQLIRAMMARLLEPLMNKPNKALGHGVLFFQGGMVARLMQIQQHDEDRILKITGLLRDDAPGRGDLVVTEQYERIRSNLDNRLLEMAKGDPEEAARARLALADLLMPLSEMPQHPTSPFTYTDMGPVDYEHRTNGNNGNGAHD